MGEEPTEYVRKLQARAMALGLADAPLWRALGHYQPDLLGGGLTSLADDEEFFLSPRGRHDPVAELQATLVAFFDAEARVRNDEHPRCAFVARFRWLDSQLGFDPERLPPADCSVFESWSASLGARGATLVVAEAFMNNPSSMFGHTLLRLDRAPPGVSIDESDLLAYAVNFSADIGDDPGHLFAAKGLLGFYPGYFSVLPYYAKVNQYGDFEQRDLWEYRLELSQAEIDRMVRHLYELQQIRFDYWFFDENCSYELLGLIDVARPGLDLRGRFRVWAIPIDTAREVLSETGLAGEPVWRPSLVTRLRTRAAALPPDARALAHALARGEATVDEPALAAYPEATQALVLTVAVDQLQLDPDEGGIEEARARSLALLAARSRIPIRGERLAPPIRPAASPAAGHDTRRLRLGIGVRDGDSYVEARLRPVFHEILEPGEGFLTGAAIELGDVALRHRPGEDDVDLHEVVVADIVSLAPRDGFFAPVSWRFRTAVGDQLIPSGNEEELRGQWVWQTELGLGAARDLAGARTFAFLEATSQVSSHLEHDYALGFGASVGWLLSRPGVPVGAELRLRYTGFVAGDPRTRLQASLRGRYSLDRNNALELRLDGIRDFGRDWLESGLYWSHFF